MSIWTNHTNLSHDIYTVVYLLKDALQSALDDAWFFERAACPKPDMKGAGHAEIAARLGRFRDACNGLREREALMLTKLLRARQWASELRRLSPELLEEIDQFLDATAECHKLQAEFMKDAQSRFHGGGTLSRFLAERRGYDAFQDGQPAHAISRDYRVGGQAALFELRAACEVFLAQVDDEFFPASPFGGEAAETGAASPASLLPYFDAGDEQKPMAVSDKQAVH